VNILVVALDSAVALIHTTFYIIAKPLNKSLLEFNSYITLTKVVEKELLNIFFLIYMDVHFSLLECSNTTTLD